MIQSTITEKFTDEDLAFLLAFEAREVDEHLVQMRDDLYFGAATTSDEFLQQKAISLATRLETVTNHLQIRLHRRYKNLQTIH